MKFMDHIITAYFAHSLNNIFSTNFIRSISIKMQTTKIAITLKIAWSTMVFVPYWPTLLRMSCHSHCRIISLFAWIRSTPKVLAPIILISLLYPIFKSLKNINEQRAVTRAIIWLLSATNQNTGIFLLTKTVDNHACHRNQYRQKVSHPQFLLDIFIGNP